MLRRYPRLIALGREIRRLRRKKGYTRTNLAMIAMVERNFIVRLERGEENTPILKVISIARLLGTTAAKLMRRAKL
jgi:transcriptional regulator with XRE-family HTH domain